MAPGVQKPRSGPRGSLTPASTDMEDQGTPEAAQTPAADADTATAEEPADFNTAQREAAADDELAPAPVHYKRRKPGSKSGSTEPEAVEAPAAGAAAVADAIADAIADAAAGAAAAGDGLAGPSGAVASAAAAAAAAGDEAVESTGLATNLGDPDCTPGTAEFAAAKDKNTYTLEVYQDRLNHHASNNEAKPDMIAYSKLRAQYTPAVPIYGHIPGVKVGDEFSGRGELAILGLHTEMMRGIMAFSAKHGPAAYAICLAGGYVDDADEGSTFWYTGQGGQEKKKQTKDQSFDTRDNGALVKNVDTSTPVRVFRGKQANKDGKAERKYVYEGLYKVTESKMEPSKDGPLVCKFKMEAIPGHSTVTGKVDYKIFGRNPFRVRDLANTAARRRAGSKRSRAPGIRMWSREQLEALIAQRAAEGANGRLVNPDIARGLEKLPIPVWNSLDDDDSIVAEAGESGREFLYIPDYKFGHEEAKVLAVEAEGKFALDCGSDCGIQYGGGGEKNFFNYTSDGLLMCTHPCGVMECDPVSKDCDFRQCENNNVVLSGLRHPLEIFKVSQQKRWGLRCPVDLPIGAVICPYIGLVIDDQMADNLRNQDLYLFDLNHFHLLAAAEEEGKLPDVGVNPRMPELPRDYRDKHLVIDAHLQGNVGRFINHSCEPNCLVQTVFAGYARSYLLYYIVIVASEDIPAFTEITYDYGYSRGGGLAPDAQSPDNNAVRINCTCGAPNCKGVLM